MAWAGVTPKASPAYADPSPPEPAPPGRAEILHWPGDEERRRELVRAEVPRLLLLDVGVTPPPPADDLEDWLWIPTDERDLLVRLRRLADRQRVSRRLEPGDVHIDDDGTLRFRDHRVLLPPAEAAIVRALAATPGRVRSRADLATAAWGESTRHPHSLDSRISVARGRLAPLGLGIYVVRGRGFLLEADGPSRAGPT